MEKEDRKYDLPPLVRNVAQDEWMLKQFQSFMFDLQGMSIIIIIVL